MLIYHYSSPEFNFLISLAFFPDTTFFPVSFSNCSIAILAIFILYVSKALFIAISGSYASSIRSFPTCANHNLNGSAFFDGIDCIKRKICSVVITSVL